MIDINRSQVSRYINNGIEPRNSTLHHIESALNVTISDKGGWHYFYEEQEEKKENYKTGGITPDELIEEGESLFSAIRQLPEIESDGLSRDDAQRILGLAESLIRSVREGLKDSDPD